MIDTGHWLFNVGYANSGETPDGLVPVKGYVKSNRPPEEVAIMEKAQDYGAVAVFFEVERDGRPPIAQAFIFLSDGLEENEEFAKKHQKLWSWGGVPLLYRVIQGQGLVQLFRCAHKADFEGKGKLKVEPYKTLKIAVDIANDPWWSAEQLRSGTIWDSPETCKDLLSSSKSAHKTLIDEIKLLLNKVDSKEDKAFPKSLRRRLLILSLLITYLEQREVFESGYFAQFYSGATRFFEVWTDGPALVKLLDNLEERFNGHVFILSDKDRAILHKCPKQLIQFARVIEGKEDANGQLSLWERYSFADLPVELISDVYQLFVEDATGAVYTPLFLVRFMLGEVLSWERLDRLQRESEVILDPSCGSGVFLVESYKRLVLHWRSQNNWQAPSQEVLKYLLTRVHGVDIEEDAVELTAFSLCLALCDALEPKEIRASVKLFPELKETSIHCGCFFEVCEQGKILEKVGVVVGNPPFASSITCSEAAKNAYDNYQKDRGSLADKQLAYLFLHQSMEILTAGGVLALIQQYNFLYNQQSKSFRQKFIELWDVREILDFISVRGLFKGGADTKALVVVANALPANPERNILHATFRRTGRTDAKLGFDIDYYDLHLVPRKLALDNDRVWRSNLVGGGRILGFVDRLAKYQTLREYVEKMGWDYGEGYIVGKRGKRELAPHITGKKSLPSPALTANGIDEAKIFIETAELFKTSYTHQRFTPPMFLIRQQMDLPHAVWTKEYLTYKDKIVGFCVRKESCDELEKLQTLDQWFSKNLKVLSAFVAAAGTTLFTVRGTWVGQTDILSIPYPSNRHLDVSAQEKILIDDIVDYCRDFIRLGEGSKAMMQLGSPALPEFNRVYLEQINAIYKQNKLRSLPAFQWPGFICQPYIFGEGEIDWTDSKRLKGRLDALLREQRNGGLMVTRIARIYDGPCIYLLKPDRLRYWLRSIALRDADDTLADLWDQGF